MNSWYADYDELTAFVRSVAKESGWTIDDLIGFLGSPWKWTAERDTWVAAGRPSKLDVREVQEAS